MDPINPITSGRLHLVAQRALRGYEALPAATKVELLLGLSEFLPSEEAEAARATAWTIQTAETQQLKFLDLLRPTGGTGPN